MNYNILAYIIYSIITVYTICWIGRLFHKNGRLFIIRLFHNHIEQADAANNILLVAYYLFNIGYSIMQFSTWRPITSLSEFIGSIAYKTGLLISILAVTHYCNILLLWLLSKKIIAHSLTNKNKVQ